MPINRDVLFGPLQPLANRLLAFLDDHKSLGYSFSELMETFDNPSVQELDEVLLYLEARNGIESVPHNGTIYYIRRG